MGGGKDKDVVYMCDRTTSLERGVVLDLHGEGNDEDEENLDEELQAVHWLRANQQP